jgi:hypothetical protein
MSDLGSRRGETQWLPSLAVLIVISLPFTVSTHSTAHIVTAALGLILLVVVVIADPGRIDEPAAWIRVTSILLTSVLAVGAALAAGYLISELLRGASELDSATTLLWTGALVWLETNLTFALLYWQLDGGGPANRFSSPPRYPDFAFTQHLNPELAPPGWMPTFLDYLHLGLTNALAFSPTDVMPMVHWAKLMMAAQSIISVAILSLVIANAVNALN